MKKRKVFDILNELIYIYSGYAKVRRTAIQPINYVALQQRFKNNSLSYKDLVVRESLIEHVGVLPIIATHLYPQINNKDIDLGHALLLLAIHDIGEIEVGDISSYSKENKESKKEEIAALKLLHPMYWDVYKEMSNKNSKTALFAKSIDKFAGDLIFMLTPIEIVIQIFENGLGKKHSEIKELIMKTTHPYMVWDSFMKDIHLELISRFESNLSKYIEDIS